MRTASTSSRLTPRALPFPDESFDAYTIAFGIRNVPRIETALAEAYRVLKRGGRFLCLEFSQVDMPGLDRLYDAYSFNVIPALGKAGDRGRASPTATWSSRSGRFPPPAAFARLIGDAGFRRVTHTPLIRRHRRHPFGLEDLSVLGAHRPSRPQSPRGLRPGARGRAGAGRSERAAASGAAGAAPRAPDRAAATRAAARRRLLGGADPARTVLRQGRPVSGDPPRHRRGRIGARSGEPAGPHAAVPARGGGADGREGARKSRSTTLFLDFSGPVAAASIAQVHQARIQTPDGEATVAVKVVRPGRARALCARSPGHALRRALGGTPRPRRAAAAAPARSWRRWPGRSRSRWICGLKRPPSRSWPRTCATTRISACPTALGPDRPRRAHHRVDRGRSGSRDIAALEAAGHDPQATRRARSSNRS